MNTEGIAGGCHEQTNTRSYKKQRLPSFLWLSMLLSPHRGFQRFAFITDFIHRQHLAQLSEESQEWINSHSALGTATAGGASSHLHTGNSQAKGQRAPSASAPPRQPWRDLQEPQPCLLQGTRTATQINSVWSPPGDGFTCRGGGTHRPTDSPYRLHHPLSSPLGNLHLFKHLLNTFEIPFKVTISGLTVPAQSSSIVPPLLLERLSKAQFAPKSLQKNLLFKTNRYLMYC